MYNFSPDTVPFSKVISLLLISGYFRLVGRKVFPNIIIHNWVGWSWFEQVQTLYTMTSRKVFSSFMIRGWLKKVQTKEYILVTERTASHSVLQTCVSPNLSPPALSDSQVVGVYYLVWCTLSILQTEQREVACTVLKVYGFSVIWYGV